ncbi:hypothetical protein I4U23_004518 [Adineta vaga]|nr:hypothetical protein I4U23_004518 [Adineta vaga]
MNSHSCFYRSLVYLHVLIAIFESAMTITLFILISITHRELFFKIKHPDDDQLEIVGIVNMIIIIALFFAGAIRTVLLLIFVIFVMLIPSACICCLCIPHCRNGYLKLIKARSTHRFLSFSCNCLCYRARPKLRFQLQFVFVLLISCVRIGMIAFCLVIRHNITTKSLAVIVAISFFFLILTSLLDYYHYRIWWHYKPQLTGLEADFEMPTTSLSKKHKRYIPYHLLGDHRTMRFDDKACSNNNQCQNRDLEHIFIFHFEGYHPQPRYFDIQQTKSGKKLYIGFHQTDAESATLIAHSDFRISTRYESTMIGHGIYFARSREGTERKANRCGAYICAEINMGRVLKLEPDERNLYRDPRYDEFCIKDPSQILKWIIVIKRESDTKVTNYGLDGEFDDTKC